MSQFDFGNLSSPLSGTAFIDSNLEPWRDAIHTSHSGTSRPSYAVKGLVWLDTTTDPNILNMFDGVSTDIPLGKFYISLGKFVPENISQYGGSAGGTGDVQTLTPTIPLAAYAAGVAYDYLVTATNTIAGPTMNISGLGTRTLKCSVGGGKVDLPIGGAPSGMIARIVDDGTDLLVLNMRPYNQGVDIATATTLNLDNATGDYVHLTGTTTITDITLAQGREVTCIADDIFTLTDGSGNSPQDVIIPGGSITTAAGDAFVVRGEADGTTRIINFTRLDGTAVVGAGGITLGTPVASTSGTAIDFTSIPAGTKRITINFDGVSTTGTDNTLIQLGDAGGIEATGYLGGSSVLADASQATARYTTGFGIRRDLAADIIHGTMVLTLVDASTFTWASYHALAISNVDGTYHGGGSKSLSAELDQIRITTVGGSDTFDAGKINITYE